MAKLESQKNWIASTFTSALLIIVVKLFWPSLIPFDAFEFWSVKGTAMDWLVAGWPLLAWGTFMATLAAALNGHLLSARAAKDRFWTGVGLSVFAGVMEEIAFRWLIFLSAIVAVKWTNFLLLGFIGLGIPEFLYLHLGGPLADFTTFGALHPQLFHPASWAVGAAILSANAFFRDGHKYQGPVGWINSWFCGMFLFWVMFHYGLPIAILLHFVYDLLFDLIGYAGVRLRMTLANR